jgi:Transglutaminase-like superfamily
MTRWKSLRRKYHTFIALSGYERSLLVRAWCLLPIVAMLVQSRGLGFTQDLLARLPCRECEIERLDAHIQTTVRMVRVAVRYNHSCGNCLKQSLVLWVLLRVQGIASEIRIGVQREADLFCAHAWVEYQGRVLNDTTEVHQQFQAFDRTFDRPLGEKL